jgi:hypothetical protein
MKKEEADINGIAPAQVAYLESMRKLYYLDATYDFEQMAGAKQSIPILVGNLSGLSCSGANLTSLPGISSESFILEKANTALSSKLSALFVGDYGFGDSKNGLWILCKFFI